MLKYYFRLIRVNELLFIAFIQVFVYELVIKPLLQTYGFTSLPGQEFFSLLFVSTLLIACGGFILNDYFDVKIDNINRPEKQLVNTIISRSKALRLYYIITSIGILSGLLFALLIKSFSVGLVFIIVTGLSWFFSASYKRMFLIGNIIISFIIMLTTLVEGISIIAIIQNTYGNLIFETPLPKHFYSWIGGFSTFLFFCTWIREIIKDMEGIVGERELECRTMPIVWGINKTKIFIIILVILTLTGLYVGNYCYIPYQGNLTFKYITYGITLPYIGLVYLIISAKNTAEFHQANIMSRVIAVLGIAYSLVFYYLEAKTHGISIFDLFIVK